MINNALTYLKTYLTTELNKNEAGKLYEAELGALNRDGQIVDSDILITLTHIEEERSVKSPEHYRYIRNESGQVEKVININPDILLNLYVLISSRKEPYETALTLISKVISIFQAKNTFKKSDFEKASGVNMKEIESLTLDLHPLSFEQNNSLWQTLGVTVVPSVLYKIRALVIKDTEEHEERNPILPEKDGGGITLITYTDADEDEHKKDSKEDKLKKRSKIIH